jgi:hypothetical protein
MSYSWCQEPATRLKRETLCVTVLRMDAVYTEVLYMTGTLLTGRPAYGSLPDREERIANRELTRTRYIMHCYCNTTFGAHFSASPDVQWRFISVRNQLNLHVLIWLITPASANINLRCTKRKYQMTRCMTQADVLIYGRRSNVLFMAKNIGYYVSMPSDQLTVPNTNYVSHHERMYISTLETHDGSYGMELYKAHVCCMVTPRWIICN